MKLSEIMTREVQILQPDDTLSLAAQKMRDYDIGFLPVCDGESLMGALTDRDIAIRALAGGMDINVMLGRDQGDWIFPYDQTMSGRHAEIVSEDIEFFVHDAGSRNGVAMAVRGDREIKKGQRFLLGDQIMRVENV